MSVYLDSAIHRRGRDRRVYTVLLNRLGAQGHINAQAAIALPNPASVGSHEALGFTPQEPQPWFELHEQIVSAALDADIG